MSSADPNLLDVLERIAVAQERLVVLAEEAQQDFRALGRFQVDATRKAQKRSKASTKRTHELLEAKNAREELVHDIFTAAVGAKVPDYIVTVPDTTTDEPAD
jgi:hypothetical protein